MAGCPRIRGGGTARTLNNGLSDAVTRAAPSGEARRRCQRVQLAMIAPRASGRIRLQTLTKTKNCAEAAAVLAVIVANRLPAGAYLAGRRSHRPVIRKLHRSLAVAAVMSVFAAAPVVAQVPRPERVPVQGLTQQSPATALELQPDANRTRGELHALLERHAPALREVLALDPSLLSNQAYLAPYPGLSAFLAAHPDI